MKYLKIGLGLTRDELWTLKYALEEYPKHKSEAFFSVSGKVSNLIELIEAGEAIGKQMGEVSATEEVPT